MRCYIEFALPAGNPEILPIMLNENTDPTGRDQKTSLLLDAPLEWVWEIWTSPGHICHWWGPHGFTNTIQKMEPKTGGEWLFTMHGPNGQSYPNHTRFREVVNERRIVHEHFDPNFLATIEFQPHGTDKTLLTWYKLYETRELFELVEIQYKSNEGFRQTVERMNSYLASPAQPRARFHSLNQNSKTNVGQQ
jgi:uncharacterized protein YndB with AHSA1/START domain